MKIKKATLLVITIVMVSPLIAQNSMDMDDFSQYKRMLLPTLQKSLEPLKQTRDCVLQSKSSDELNKCVQIMVGKQGQAAAMPKLEWNPTLVKNLASDLERSLNQNMARISCLDSSSDRDEMAACMRRAGF